MSAFPGFTAGDEVTAQSLNDMQASAVVATAAQSVNNTTTLTTDNTLSVPVLASANYFIEFFLIFSQSSTLNADVKTVWSVPTGAQGLKQIAGPTSSTTVGAFVSNAETDARVAGHLLTTVAAYNMDNIANNQLAVIERAAVSVSSVAGNVAIQWAQNTAQVQNLTRLARSFVRVARYL